MNKSIGLQLVAYSLLLAGLSFLAHHLVPDLAGTTLDTGLMGGALCLVWGMGAVLGQQGKAAPILTLIPVSFVMFAQSLVALGAGGQKLAPDRTVAAVTFLILAISLGMLMRIAFAGAASERDSPSPAKDGETKSTKDKESGKTS